MSFLRNLAAFAIYTISLSYALQCTKQCSFTTNLNTSFEIPNSCDQTTSVKYCAFRMSFWHQPWYSSVSFYIDSSNYSLNEYHSATAELSDSGSTGFNYIINYECKHKDDCALEFARNKMPDILRRLAIINYDDMRTQLFPLLISNSSIEDIDLACFDSNENVRQCAIGKKLAVCQATHQLTGQKKPVRSCNHEPFHIQKSVNIVDFDGFASFEIKCNRSLCNGPMTLQAVKEIMFNHSITKTIEGRLNNSLRLSLSSTFLMLIILVLLI